MLRIIFLVTIFGAFSPWSGLSAAQAESASGRPASCFSTAWPHEQSHLAVDPSLHFGRLDNGLRYVLRKNAEPRERTAIYLGVLAGSVQERDDQRGLAHFVEHMVFNGSTHFAPGQLIDYFQAIGMSFGGDTNALTAYDRTVYKIILPNSARQDLQQGLLVMSDFARGATFDPAEVDRERGVILAEMTARDSASYRAFVAESAFTLRGTRAAERMPIGVVEVLNQAESDDLRAFYDAWYRPENMILVVVGDFDTTEAEELVQRQFAPLQGRGEAPSCPDLGRLAHRGVDAFYHFEPELGSTEVVLETVSGKEPEHDSLELQRRSLYRLLVGRMLNHRLGRLVEDPATVINTAGYYETTLLDRFRIAGVRAKVEATQWPQGLAEIDRVRRQALTYGFTQSEVDRVKRQLLAELDQGVQTSQTRNSVTLAATLLSHLQADRVMMSPEQERALYTPMIEAVTAAELAAVFQDEWRLDTVLVKVIGATELVPAEASQQILATYRALQEEAVAPPEALEALVFPYLPVAVVGPSPSEQKPFGDIGAVSYRFGDELVVNVKRTDFQKETVVVSVQFGQGRDGLPHPGLDLLAAAVVNNSGSGRYRATELQQILAGSSVQFRFQVGEESFSWEGQALHSDLEKLLQMIQTVLADPGFRQDAYERAMENFALMYRQLENNVEGAVRRYLEPFFAGGVPGFGLPDWDAFSQLQLADVVGWLEPPFGHAPLEISVVGDIDPEQVRDLVARYFTGRPVQEVSRLLSTSPRFPAGETLQESVATSIDKAVVRTAWLTDDFWDISRARRLHVLAAVFEDRLRREVRERLGASYSPGVYSYTSRSYAGYGMVVAEVVAESGLVETVRETIDAVAASLQNAVIGDAELERAKNPLATSLKQSVRSNTYWLHSVLALSSRHPEQLRWPLTMVDDFAAVTGEEVRALAERYLIPQRRAVGIVKPAAPVNEASETVLEEVLN